MIDDIPENEVGPVLAVHFLNEGFVLAYNNYSTAHATPQELATKVYEYAARAQGVGLEQPLELHEVVGPLPISSSPRPKVEEVPSESVIYNISPSARASARDTTDPQVVSTPISDGQRRTDPITTEDDPRTTPQAPVDQAAQLRNLNQINSWLGAGYRPDGMAFSRREWDEALADFAPNLNPREAEAILGEYLGSIKFDEDEANRDGG